MNINYEFTITFQLKTEAENVESASLKMRKHIDEIYWMTGSDEFTIDLKSIKNTSYETIYTPGIEFYPDGVKYPAT